MLKPLIYLVEDDPIFLKILERFLSDFKLTNFKSFTRGEDCLEEIKKRPTYLFLDFSLEGMNGLDVLREVKKASRKTKVIMFTVVEDQSVEQKCLKAGAHDYFIKNEEGLAKFKNILIRIAKYSRYKKLLGIVIIIIILSLIFGFLNLLWN